MDFSALIGHQDMLSPGTAEIAQLRADAVQLLQQIDSRENLQSTKVIPLPAGMWNALYRLEPIGLVVKLSVGDNDFEVNFLRQAAELNILAPRVLSMGKCEHPSLSNISYFLMTYIPNSLNAWHLIHEPESLKLQNLGRELGLILAKLHSVHLGYISRFGTRVHTWQETITDGFSPDWDNPAPNALFDEELLSIFKRILHKTNYLAFQDGSLIHCDLNLSNVLVDADTKQLTAILDPGGYAGMPMFDLAYAAMPWDYGFEFFHALLETYQQNAKNFDAALFYTSILVVAYRHVRFHTPLVRESIFKEFLPKLGF